MKVIHIISDLKTGGAQKLVGDLLPLLNKEDDIDLELIVFEKSDSEIERNLINEGVKIINLNTSPRSPKAILRLYPLLKNTDLIHVHLFPVNYLVALINFFLKKPLVFTEHSTHNRRRDHKFLRPIEKIIYRTYKKIGCISQATGDALKEWIGPKIAESRTTIIENGIDLKKFNGTSDNKSKSLLGRDGYPILMISRFVESKDQPTLIRAMKYVSNPEAFVVFVGDGENRKKCEELAESLNINDKIFFLGTRYDVPDLVKASYIGVQSSNWEGFGLTAVEMMAGGLPVIASDVNGLRQVVEGAGLIFEKGNEKKLAEQINQLLDDKVLYEKLVNNSKERADNYSIDKTAQKYFELYESTLQY